MNNRNQRHLGN